MQRSGPQFATKRDPKTGEVSPSLPPRVKQPNPQPQGSGIIDRLRRATSQDERDLLREEGSGYTLCSGRTKRRLRNLS